MPEPVRIKLYGLPLTRRGYLRFLAAGLVLAVLLLLVWAVALGGPPRPEEEVVSGPTFVLILRRVMPWVILAALVLESIEALIVLNRFRRAEAQQHTAPERPPESP